MTAPRFLAWLRRGISSGIGEPDPGGALTRRAKVKAVVQLEDSRGTTATATTTRELVGPADVVGLDPGQIVRFVPPAGAADVEPNDFPFVELVAPDLPWLLTPAQPAAGGDRLRPWMVLVCVEQRDGITFDAGARPLPVLRMSGSDAARELPDLAESWAWAHAQSMVPGPQVDGEVQAGSGAVIARLICPRQLLPDRRYRAAVVPAFDLGRLAGLGEDVSASTTLRPAWDLIALPEAVELPVYATWTFSTSDVAADFEELARRLQPDTDGGRMGYHGARVTRRELLPPFEGPARFEYGGPLVDPDSRAAELPERARMWFEDGMRKLLDTSANRADVPRAVPPDYEPERDDPIVGPPMYGSYAMQRFQLPRQGWMPELNLLPRTRAAAGLGARVVREHQHELVAAAWDQAGDLRALQEQLNRSRLAAELGRSHAKRFGAASDEALLQTTGRLHVFVPVGATNVAARLRRSAVVPAALCTPVFARQTRISSLLARRARRPNARASVGLRATRQFVAASAVDRVPDQQPVARFGASFVGRGAVTAATSFAVADVEGSEGSTVMVLLDEAPAIQSTVADAITAVAAAIRTSLDPMRSVVAGLDVRLTGMTLDLAADLPTRVPIGPRFLDPLLPKLLTFGSQLVVPGIDAFGLDRVRLLEVDETWIAAFLAGANHEWAREALWNEYPADLRATAFSHFWPRVPAAADLANDLHDWLPLSSALADHVGGAGSSTVLLVRGELIRHYPDTEFLLVTPAADGSVVDDDGALPAERVTWPSFAGRLDAETAFVGFDVDADDIRDAGMYVGLQEPISGPSFGLDTAGGARLSDYGTRPTSWRNLSWAHMADSPAALAALSHVRLVETPWLAGTVDGLEWPRNAAHLAGITFQQPFRLLLPASALMPPARREPR